MKSALQSLADKVAYRWRRATFRAYWRDLSVAGVPMTIAIDDLFAEGVYQSARLWPELEWALKNVRNASSVMIDVGANQGITTLFYAKSFPDSIVMAVEPHPFNARQILKNTRRNIAGNIVLAHCAASDHQGELRLSDHSNASAVETEGIRVPVNTLDSLCAEAVGFLKIDVEGAEDAVLRGAKNVIAKHKPVMDIEVHLFMRENRHAFLNDLVLWLSTFGYAFDVVAGYQGRLVVEPTECDWELLSNEHVINLLCRPK